MYLNLDPALYSRKNLGICNFLKDKVQNEEDFVVKLKNLIKLSKLDLSLSHSSANALSILVYSSQNFTEEDFSNLYLSKSNLHGGVFIKCSFESTDLSNSNLSASILRACNFSQADLQGSKLEEADIS